MTTRDFVFSADGHVVEPTDLFRTRLPRHLRDRGFWEEDFEIEPLVEGGVRDFARVRTPGFEGWAVSRYRHFDGTPHTGDPDRMIEDMDLDGIDAQLMHPNRSLFALYSDDHELSMAHARVYNDYVVERYAPYFRRIAPTAPIPLSEVGEAVVEIERVRRLPCRAPARVSPLPYWSSDLEPVWDAVSANGMHVFFHCATGGVKVGGGRRR
jgi:predicted TIM-barrel fold metal-dependent hydrolase